MVVCCFVLKTAEAATSAGNCHISYPTVIVLWTVVSNWLSMSLFCPGDVHDNVGPASTLGWLFFPSALGKARFLEPYLLLASTLNEGSHSLGAPFTAAFAALVVRKGCRRQPEVKKCSLSRNTAFQAARAGWSHRRSASVLSFAQPHYFLLGHDVSRHHVGETLEAVFRTRGRCYSSV